MHSDRAMSPIEKVFLPLGFSVCVFYIAFIACCASGRVALLDEALRVRPVASVLAAALSVCILAYSFFYRVMPRSWKEQRMHRQTNRSGFASQAIGGREQQR